MNGSSGTSTVGSSNTNKQGNYSYSQILNHLTTYASDPAQLIAVANLPATDPSPSGPSTYKVPNAEAKALGLLGANNTGNDGTITFGAGYNWAFNPNNRAVAGEYDFVGIVEHELSEVMGRVWGLGNDPIAGRGYYVPLDLFRYDGGPPFTNTRDMTNNTNVWFSINGGNTEYLPYNFQYPSTNDTEDPSDWGISNTQASLTNDAFNAYSAGGVVNALSSTDLTLLNVMGFHLSAAAMSGGTWARNGNGSWSTGGNWTYPVVPSGITVYFAGVPVNPSAPITVTLDGNQSAGALVFNTNQNIDGYTLAQGSGGALSLGTPSGGSITVVAGYHSISAPMTLQGPLTVNVASGWTLSLDGAIGEANPGTSFTFNGPGKLTVGGNNSYSGGTTINGGLLQVFNDSALGSNTAPLAVNGGTLDVFGFSIVVGGLSGVGLIDNLSVNGTLTVGNGNASGGFSGTIQDSSAQLSLVKTGTGIIGLSGVVNLSGSITVNGGFLSQLAGNVQASTLLANGGTYYLSAGQFAAGQVAVATGGTLSQAGGTAYANSGLDINGPGSTYYLENPGWMSASPETVGDNSSGIVTQIGGTQLVSGGLILGRLNGSSGSYGMSNGALGVDNEYVGFSGKGAFAQSGGTHTVTGTLALGASSGGNGFYLLSAGSLYANWENLGVSGSGYFTQTGGTNSSPVDLNVGDGGVASYSLSGGLVSTLELSVGGVKNGSFTQTGGRVLAGGGPSIALLVFGNTSSYPATYNLQSGLLSVTGQDYIGYLGTGNFVQSGGTHTVSGGTLMLGKHDPWLPPPAATTALAAAVFTRRRNTSPTMARATSPSRAGRTRYRLCSTLATAPEATECIVKARATSPYRRSTLVTLERAISRSQAGRRHDIDYARRWLRHSKQRSV